MTDIKELVSPNPNPHWPKTQEIQSTEIIWQLEIIVSYKVLSSEFSCSFWHECGKMWKPFSQKTKYHDLRTSHNLFIFLNVIVQ